MIEQEKAEIHMYVVGILADQMGNAEVIDDSISLVTWSGNAYNITVEAA